MLPKRTDSILAGVTRLVTLVAVLGGCASPGTQHSLRIMTYNIRHGEGMDGVVDLARIAAVISAAQPDAVALQEVDLNTGRTGRVDQAATLARLTGLEHHVFGAFMDYDGGRYGMAILSRYPIESSRVIELPPGRLEPRTSLLARVARPGAPFVLVGVHFDWLEDDGARFAQAKALVRAVADEIAPVVIAGDFNDVPGSRTIELLDGVWTRIPKEPGAAFTFPSPDPEKEIDMIYLENQAAVPTGMAMVIDERFASDHWPVVTPIKY